MPVEKIVKSFDFDALDHERFMREALKEAELAGQAGEKPIGAVIVLNGQVIGRGRAGHLARHSAIAHAEMNALLQAEQTIYAHKHDGCVIYTTLEPCVMCLGAIVMSDVDHIVFALADHWINPAAMLDMDHVRRHIQHYVGGILESDSIKLWERYNQRELKMLREGRIAT
jgi:tRNA(adenine34) deaminase